jgi:hypothetical protein
MDLETVKQDINTWIENFVEVSHPSLGGWPPCPYARNARLNQEYDVRIGINPLLDLAQIALSGLGNKKVIVLAYDAERWDYNQFHEALDQANAEFLLNKDIIALEDHPSDPEIVNGVSMNQGTYALALVQSLSDLDAKARLMADKGFYDTWPEDYLQSLFSHRKDPRK